jgi:hypothetical protein
MMDLSKPDIILTHESDLDGFVAGLFLQKLAKKMFNREVPLEAYHYNYWKQRELRETAAWVADFTFETRMDKPEWTIIDHHVTEAEPKFAHLIHDKTKSAGMLCYEICKKHGLESPAMERLAHLNNVADLFLENDPDFEIAGDYAALVKVYQFWNLHSVIDGDIEKLLNHPLLEVMAVKRRVEDPLGFEWSKKNVTEITPVIGYVDTVIGNNNLIVHQLLERGATKFPVLVTLFKRPNNAVIASFRSRNGEALKVAEKLQGGGHANASGAMLPKSVRSLPDGIEYLRQVLSLKHETPLNSFGSLLDSFSVAKR